MIISIAILFVLAGFGAWEEIQQLIQRGNWKREDYRDIIWEIDYKSKWKLFDSHHVAYGLFVLTMCFAFVYIKLELWQVPLTWFIFFYFRNIFMHIVLKKKPIWSFLYTFWK